MLWSVQLFGFNFFAIKVPFIIYSFVTLIFLYLVAAMISKPLALLAAFLYSISPWAIIQSNITRDYSFDLMIATMVIYFSLALYTKNYETNSTRQSIVYGLLFCLPPLMVYFIYSHIRVQTLISGIYIMVIGIAFIYCLICKVSKIPALIKMSYWPLAILPLIISTYIFQRFPFESGFHQPDYNFIKIFFDPGINSPWQWFYNIHVNSYLIAFLFFLGVVAIRNKGALNSNYLLMLFLSFAYGIFIFSFKYESHLDYIPVRYVYFLFAPYVILLANGIINILKPFNGFIKFIIIASLLLCVNYQAITYSINPKLAYEKEGIATLSIDNINIGRFHLIEVINYLENELNVTDNSILVFDGRYEEFILYMDRPMDKDRYLLRPSNNKRHDIAKNTYVQSIFFGYSELFQAINHKSGIYVTDDVIIYDPLSMTTYSLDENSLTINNIELEYINTINGFKIYAW